MSLKKAILWVVFVTSPVMILTGLLVHAARDLLIVYFGYEITDFTYNIVLVLLVWVAMVLTSRKVFKYMYGKKNM